MPQIKITITDEEYLKLEQEANLHLNSISKEARVILHQHLYNSPGMSPTPVTPIPAPTLTPTPAPTIPNTPITPISTPDPIPETPYKITVNSSKTNPLIWLEENVPDPMNTDMQYFKEFKKVFPDLTLVDYDHYQELRRNRYVPDPNDPFDPTINNPYLKNKK